MSIPNLAIIGDRINPGFKATRTMIEQRDFKGIQDLAKRQVQTGAIYLDVTIGPKGYEDYGLLSEVIQAIQAAVDTPLCFDYPHKDVLQACLKTYDPAKAGGRRPLINSLAETRWEIMDLMGIQPFNVILMASERLDEGSAKPNKRCEDVHKTAKRSAERLVKEHGLELNDIYIDVTVSTLVSDTEGLVRMALDAIESIGLDPDLKGIHIVGGLTNIGNMLPPVEFDGMKLRHVMESAFLTVAVPYGFDTVLGTPWNEFRMLPEDHVVLQTFREVIDLKGLDAMRRLRKLWANK
jgi:5-methyltetrahydrofolate--homocysteine methyltransferase